MTPEFSLRLYSARSDASFVVPHWLSGAQKGHPLVPRRSFFDLHERYVRARLERSHAYVIVHPDDPSALIGFVCFDRYPFVLHWIYVAKISRRMGLARKVLEDLRTPGDSAPMIATGVSVHTDWQSLARRLGVISYPYMEAA